MRALHNRTKIEPLLSDCQPGARVDRQGGGAPKNDRDGHDPDDANEFHIHPLSAPSGSKEAGAQGLLTNDLDQDFLFPPAVELGIEDGLIHTQVHTAFRYRHHKIVARKQGLQVRPRVFFRI